MEILVLLLVVMSIAYSAFEPEIKGSIGEKKAAAVLSGLPPQQYKLLNDVMLQTDYGTTQIDHIVVSVYGIFVIETKNYKGWITGSEYGEHWTKNMYGKKYTFRNPLMQNYAHVKALEEKLGLPEDRFIPIVAFSDNSDIKVKTKTPVVYIGQLTWVIRQYRTLMFQEKELDLLVEKIKSANIVTRKNKREHVQRIQTKVADNKAKVEQGICPRCGGKLVARKGKNGFFLGCSNYPKCRYTRN